MQAPVPPIDPEKYSAAYNELQKWISTKQEQLASRDFPDMIEETQQLLETFRKHREEEKQKEKDIQDIGAMEKKLTEFQQRHKIDFQLPQFNALEKVKCTVCESHDANLQYFLQKWSQYQTTHHSYEKDLETHLQKLMEIERERLKKVTCRCKRLDDKQQKIHSQVKKHVTA